MFTSYVCAVEDGLRSLVEDLDPDAIALPEAPKLWAAFDRLERLAASAKPLLARRVEESGVWKQGGFRSAEETAKAEAEDSLLHDAENVPLADLRERSLTAKAKDADATHTRIRRDRYARVFKDGEGAWNLRARGTVDDGARFMNAFQPLIDAHFKRAGRPFRGGQERRRGDIGEAEAEAGEVPGSASDRLRDPGPRRCRR